MIRVEALGNSLRITVIDQINRIVLISCLPDNSVDSFLTLLFSGYYKSSENKRLINEVITLSAEDLPLQYRNETNSFIKESILNFSESVLQFIKILEDQKGG